MSEHREPGAREREIDISRARPKKGLTAAAPHPGAAARTAPAVSPAQRPGGDALSQSVPGKAHAGGAARPPDTARGAGQTANGAGAAAAGKKRPAAKRKGRTAAIAALCVLLLLVGLVGGIYLYVDSMVQESDLGSFDDVSKPASTSEEPSIVPPDFSGVRNILVLGLDYEEDGEVERDKDHPNTDMILYMRLDGNAHTLTMLQIPRDVFVGEAGGGAGKINGILAQNVDSGNGLGAVKSYIETNFGLPIDDYITIDMDALRDLVDVFDGVWVYVPQNMRYYNEQTGALEGELLQGWQKLMGDSCEFFLRYRQGLVRADLDRLVMQRQFYAGLFRRLKTAAVQDIVKLLPLAQQYIRTDISTLELMSIAIEVSGMDSANIAIGRLPVYQAAEKYYGIPEGTLPVVTAKEETAALLNEYFRPADDPISAADIGTPDWPTTGGAAGAEMSTMGDVEAVGGEAPPQ